MPLFIAISVIAALFSFILTGAVRAMALNREILDKPNERSSHTVPTPRGGGIAVVVSSVLAICGGAIAGLMETRASLTIGAGIVLLGIVGWIDDVRSLRPVVRLAAQTTVALATVYLLGGMPSLQYGSGLLQLGATGFVLAVIGIVWSINLFNFMDGIDGLAGSQAVVIFAALAALLTIRGDYSLAAVAMILAATCAGFLAWNWPPAKIFLGDVGSAPIGYAIASLALAAENHGSVPLLVVAIIYGVFIADASVTLIRRLVRGSRIMEAHRDHAYQRLTRAWGAHAPVTRWTVVVTAILAIIAAVATLNQRLVMPSVLAVAFFLGILLFAVERRAPL